MPAPFFIYVNGSARPKRAQPDIDTARAEADRLYKIHERRKQVLILETTEVIEPTERPILRLRKTGS